MTAKTPPRSLRRVALSVTFLSTALLVIGGAYVWRHRVALIEVPAAWRQARLAGALDLPDSPFEGRVRDHAGAQRFGDALLRLVELQALDDWLPPGSRVSSDVGQNCETPDSPRLYYFDSFKDVEGRVRHLACFLYDERFPPPWPADVTRMYSRRHWFFDDHGRLLPVWKLRRADMPESDFLFACGNSLAHRESSSHPDAGGGFVCAVDTESCWTSGAGVLATLDAKGFVPLGEVLGDPLASGAPIPIDDSGASVSRPPESVVALLRPTGSAGDLHRGLYHLAKHGGHLELAKPLLTHESPVVRTHALAVSVSSLSWERIVWFLEDPSPRVRLTAFRHLMGSEADGRRLDVARRVVRDRNLDVRLYAYEFLARHAPAAEAERALVTLLEARFVTGYDRIDLRGLSSSDVARAALGWAEEHFRESPDDTDSLLADLMARQFWSFRSEDLEPLAPRLVGFARSSADDYVRQGVLVALAGLESEEAQRYVLRFLQRPSSWPESWLEIEDDESTVPIYLLQELSKRQLPPASVRQDWFECLRRIYEKFKGTNIALASAGVLTAWGTEDGVDLLVPHIRLSDHHAALEHIARHSAPSEVVLAVLETPTILYDLTEGDPDFVEGETGVGVEVERDSEWPSEYDLCIGVDFLLERLLDGGIVLSKDQIEAVVRFTERFPHSSEAARALIYLTSVGRISETALAKALFEPPIGLMPSFDPDYYRFGAYVPKHGPLQPLVLRLIERLLELPERRREADLVAGRTESAKPSEEAVELLTAERAYRSHVCRELLIACIMQWPTEAPPEVVSVVQRVASLAAADVDSAFAAHLLLAYWHVEGAEASIRRFVGAHEDDLDDDMLGTYREALLPDRDASGIRPHPNRETLAVWDQLGRLEEALSDL